MVSLLVVMIILVLHIISSICFYFFHLSIVCAFDFFWKGLLHEGTNKDYRFCDHPISL